jgi:hypothetical protein
MDEGAGTAPGDQVVVEAYEQTGGRCLPLHHPHTCWRLAAGGARCAAPEQCRDLLGYLAQIADPREQRGRRHALTTVLMSGTSGDRAATSQVYSLRIPVDRLAELRQVAEADGVEPSALMRQWVLDWLDAEKAPCGEATDAELLGGKLDTARRLLDEVRQAVERLLADTGA